MSKMDGVASRTPADIERKYNFGKSFAEIMGIAKDAQTHAVEAERIVKKIQEQGLEIDVVEELNASADVISLNSNRLEVNSDNFTLTKEGKITAKQGNIANWSISEDFIGGTIEDTTTRPYDGNIYKKVYRTVKLQAPDDSSEHVFSVSMVLSDGAENTAAFENCYITSNGEFLSRKINYIDGRVLFSDNPDYVQIADGKITIKSAYKQTLDNYRSYLLLTFTVEDELYGLYALFAQNNYGEWEYYSTRCFKIE